MKHTLAPLIAALGAAFGTAPLAHAEILIGASGPMTGTLAWFGEQMQQGMDMKVAELNATGGVLGQQVELLMVDDYCDPAQAVAAAEKLVEARVAAVIGHFCSGASIPAFAKHVIESTASNWSPGIRCLLASSGWWPARQAKGPS
jgi:branched-chain amino acid transport system substrate-binding protein